MNRKEIYQADEWYVLYKITLRFSSEKHFYNVIHLLDEPNVALDELMRVCKNGGKIIIPTYVNNENDGKPSVFIRLLEKFGAGFKKQFDFTTYMLFFGVRI